MRTPVGGAILNDAAANRNWGKENTWSSILKEGRKHQKFLNESAVLITENKGKRGGVSVSTTNSGLNTGEVGGKGWLQKGNRVNLFITRGETGAWERHGKKTILQPERQGWKKGRDRGHGKGMSKGTIQKLRTRG